MPLISPKLRRLLNPLAKPLLGWARSLAYRHRLAKGKPAGKFHYVFRPTTEAGQALVDILLPAGFGSREAQELCRWQTLPEVRALGIDAEGNKVWCVNAAGQEDPEAAEAPWFFAPGRPEPTYPAHLEAAWLVAAAEEVDAVTLLERLEPSLPEGLREERVLGPSLRPFTLFRRGAYLYDGADDVVRPLLDNRLLKVIDSAGASDPPQTGDWWNAHRRGPYLASQTLLPELEIGIRDASVFERVPTGGTKKERHAGAKEPLLVTTSFLARGGAEHTLFETLRALRGRFAITLVTLAPHRPELGDRREDFREITERLLCLGDLVHPAAMPGILDSLVRSTGTRILHNSNGTTLFYDFIPRLKQTFPQLRVVDHLYDHRVGYIDRYDRALMDSVDACVAENRRIAQVLVEERGWPEERVPVIWPCGRRADAFPDRHGVVRVRRELRQELRVAPEDLLILTAARMHPQKRPLDLVHLARRTQDLHQVHYLIVGGGELEEEVDEAIAAQPGVNIRRLPFRTDIPELIVASDVGCLVSDYEGLPVFMLECLQAGRPFLGTEVGEMGHVLRETGAGLVVEKPGDLDALEDQVRGLLDTSLWTDLAERAAEAGDRFEVEACAERYAAAFLGEG